MNLKEKIRVIPDFPQPGIRFKDITPLLRDGDAFRYAIKTLADLCRNKDIDLIVGPEARGFVIGAPLAYELGKGFVPVRKKGKLPGETIKSSYGLEYGEDSLEIHKDSIIPGQKVLLADDLLATGGTISTSAKLIEQLGGKVAGAVFLIELTYLNGREKLSNLEVTSLVRY